MKLEDFNQLPKEEARNELEKCCVSNTWINSMVKGMPFSSADELLRSASDIWYSHCEDPDYLEAFSGHPKIGDMSSHKEQYKQSRDWAGMEQAAIADAVEDTFNQITHYNGFYEERFGYIFIVSATGKSADEMLALLKARVPNDKIEEMKIAMGEQHKITCIRLAKLIPELVANADQSSHVTTHVLDTSSGIPGEGMVIRMKEDSDHAPQTIAIGITNRDGRISNLLPPGLRLESGNYTMVFETERYFQSMKQSGFYPEVTIRFTIADESHYHIPLLLNPYGYTTYRGS